MEKNTPISAIRFQNRSNIYQIIKHNPKMSRQEVLRSLDLSLPTVTKNMLELEQEGLIKESGLIRNTGGRSAKTYSIVKNARIAIGLDITRNHVTGVAVDLNGDIIASHSDKLTFERSDAYYQRLGAIVSSVILDSSCTKDQVLGVGIGVPGLISPDNKTITYGEILNFTGATCAEFSQYLDLPSALYNDANAAGFAEMWALQGLENAFYIMLSNNVGGSVWINNQCYCGDTIQSGEVGHLTLVEGGETCYCGQKGCVDRYLAATVLSQHTNGDLAQFFTELKNGNKKFNEIWETYLDNLAITVNNVHTLFDCSIILGGYIGPYLEDYMEFLFARMARRSTFSYDKEYLKPCTYKKEVIAAGSALYFIEEFISSI